VVLLAIALFPACSGRGSAVSGSGEIDVERTEASMEKNEMSYLNIVELWKNGAKDKFSVSKKIDDFEFTATYKPYSILLMEEYDSLNMDQKITNDFKSKTVNYNNVHFFNFNIKNGSFKNELIKLNAENNQTYYDRIAYYSFGSKNDAYVVEDMDTLKCGFVNFERTFEANPSVTLSFAFTRKSKSTNYKKLKFVFEDKVFNKGKVIFNFDTEPVLLLNYLKPLN
jgi:hypothetical protein